MLRRWCRLIYTRNISPCQRRSIHSLTSGRIKHRLLYSLIAMTTTSLSTVLISTFCAPHPAAALHVQIFACLGPRGYNLAYFGWNELRVFRQIRVTWCKTRAFYKLLGNFLATFSCFEQLFAFWAISLVTFILRYRSIFWCLNWSFFQISPYFSRQFMNFLWKRSQILPHGRKKVVGLLGQRFWEKIQNGGRRFALDWLELSVAGEEGHSTILLAHYFFWF